MCRREADQEIVSEPSLHLTIPPRQRVVYHIDLVVGDATGLTIGLWLLYSGETQYEPVAAISSPAHGTV